MSNAGRPTGQPFTPTSKEDWVRSDAYHNSFLIPEDPHLSGALSNSREKELPNISVSTAQGKLLNLLIKSTGARRVLEVGTLGGYSTIWMAKALPEDGKIITLELNPHHAKVAEENLKNAGVSDKVEVKVGAAADTLKTLEPNPPFDFVFIDADKPGNLTYFIEAERLTRKGSVIIVDNVVRYGRVADPTVTDDANIEGVRKLLQHLKNDKAVECTTIANVGEKGYDGFMYCVRL